MATTYEKAFEYLIEGAAREMGGSYAETIDRIIEDAFAPAPATCICLEGSLGALPTVIR